MKTFIEVVKSDIEKIGTTIFPENGNTTFICDVATTNIEEILLRNILKCFGEEYAILSEDDFTWENGDMAIEYKTNLPWDLYESAKASK